MRAAKLPSTRGKITVGQQLRREMAKAIGEVETYARRGSVLPSSAAALTALFTAGNAAIAAAIARPASLAIAPGTVTLTSGATTQQLTVTATAFTGSTSDVTNSSTGTTYVSSDPTKATVAVNGLVTRVAIGTTTITASNGNKSTTRLVTVSS